MLFRLVLAAFCILPAAAQIVLSGRVVDQNDAPIAGARITVRRDPNPPIEATSSPAGAFRVTLPAPGEYHFTVDRAGYFELKNRLLDVAAGHDVTLVLNAQQEAFQSVTVGENPTPVDPEQTQREQRLSGTEVNDVPYSGSHSLRSGMALIPGVIRDPAGALHFHGGSESQTQYTLNGFDISDPIDNTFSTLLAVEGIRSLDLYSSRESPQYGRGSSGNLQIHTDTGSDEFHYTATDFIPGVDNRGGLRIGDWNPRAGFSGPIVRGRAWFSDSFDGEYNSGYVSGLPKGQNTNQYWLAGNLIHTQINLAPSDILYADVLTNFDHQAHYGLGPLDPVITTSGVSDNEELFALKESHAWFAGALLEIGGAWQRVYHRRVPEGTAGYLITPNGRQGNFYVDSTQTGTRGQFFANYYPRGFRFFGRHQLQFGTDLQRPDYTADVNRSSFQVIGLDGAPQLITAFQGSGNFRRPNFAEAVYANDHWQVAERLTVDAGLRQDWDELVRHYALSPRIGVSYSPFGGVRTKLVAGFDVLHDATSLAEFSRPLDQRAVTTPYAAGVPQAPLVTTFSAGRDLRLPAYQVFSAGAEHEFARRIAARLDWMRKNSNNGFVYAPPGPLQYGYGGDYTLTNQRITRYHEVAVTVRQSFADQYGWLASYTHSGAISNAVFDPNPDQPLRVVNDAGPLMWDVPNRLLAWGYFPLHRPNWAISALADYRTGFPFSVTTAAGVIPNIDNARFPSNFDLNIAIERRFVFRGYRFALRLGCNNVTAHANPTAVNAVEGSPQFLQFFGNEGRHLVIRIRLFGRAGRH
ncbi:MAG TPA: TonB-dependent receptor [Candidatus Limnocylindrales bacterium]|nr:TonB-dependent receptor [Candidatus Limnocylindrales bacterium]